MSHIPYENWLQYVAGELDEPTRQKYEAHLYSCDECLESYMQAVQAHDYTLPDMRTENLIEKIMTAISENGPGGDEKGHRRRPFYHQALFHYFVAAVLTFILMSSGLFAQLSQVASDFEKTPDSNPSHSITEQLMDKTLSWVPTTRGEHKEAKQ